MLLDDTGFQSISQITKAAVSAGAPATQCKMCQKKGLPILPVRYSAVAATRAHGIDGIPLVNGSFGAHVLDVASRKAKYTLRSLRYGYVYVFYPKTSAWKCYAVTKEGNCYECALDVMLDRSTEKPFSCTQTGHPELAQCITIENADKIGTVFMAFSEVQWTKAVRDAYAADKDGCRTKRMQAFNASAWYAKPGNAPHAASASNVQHLISEYKGGTTQSFLTSPFPFRDRSTEATALNTAMDHLAPQKGAVFALWDPIGITQELNHENKFAFGVVLAKYQWGSWSADMVRGIKEAIEDGAVKDDQVAEQMLEGQMMEAQALSSLFDGGKHLDKDIYDLRARTTAEAPKVREKAWEDYSTAVSATAAEEYKARAKQDFQNEQHNTWTPLSLDHVSWLSSANLHHVFQYDYDPQDPVTGFLYESAFLACVEGASARREAFDQLNQWAQGRIDDPANLLLRALLLNQKVNEERIAEAGNYPYPELRETAAKAVESFFKSAEVLESKGVATLPDFYRQGASLIYETGAPIAKVIATSLDAVAAKTAVLITCARSGKQVIVRPVQGSQSQWINYFARQMWEMTPAASRPSLSSLKASIRKQFTTKTPEGQVTAVPQFIIVDKDKLGSFDMPGALNKEKATYIASSTNKLMLTDESIEKTFVPAFRKITGGEVSSAGIGTLFALINFHYASKELEKSTHFNSEETKLKFYGSIGALIGGVSSVSGSGLEAAHRIQIKLPAALSEDVASGLKFAARWLAAPAAFIGAFYDLKNAKESWESGHAGLALLYTISFAGGVALGILALAASTSAIILPLTLLLLAVGILIMIFKERELKEFLGRTYFGTNKRADRFLSFEEEQKAYSGLGA